MTTRTTTSISARRHPGIPAYLHGRKVTAYQRRYGARTSGGATR